MKNLLEVLGTWADIVAMQCKYIRITLVQACWENLQYALTMQVYQYKLRLETQKPQILQLCYT